MDPSLASLFNQIQAGIPARINRIENVLEIDERNQTFDSNWIDFRRSVIDDESYSM